MNPAPTLQQVRKTFLNTAFIGLLGSAVVGLRQHEQFYRSYLFAYLVCIGFGLGCLGLLLVYGVTGGTWGKVSRVVLQAGSNTIPWLAILFLPVLFGLRFIYPWYGGSAGLSAHQAIYFQPLFFIGRSVFYFACWTWIIRGKNRGAGLAAASLGLYVLTVTFASIDWIMSLEPHWSSSIYGAMIMIGDVLSGLAFTVIVLNWRSRAGKAALDADASHDLGNLLLAFVMLWTYMALSQYLIIWSANLPEEIQWYLARQRGGWQVVAVLLILLQFTLPFLLLLARKRKRKLASLARVAALILALRLVDIFWLTVPDFSPGRFTVHALDVLVLMLVGGTWMAIFCRQLQSEEMA